MPVDGHLQEAIGLDVFRTERHVAALGREFFTGTNTKGASSWSRLSAEVTNVSGIKILALNMFKYFVLIFLSFLWVGIRKILDTACDYSSYVYMYVRMCIHPSMYGESCVRVSTCFHMVQNIYDNHIVR